MSLKGFLPEEKRIAELVRRNEPFDINYIIGNTNKETQLYVGSAKMDPSEICSSEDIKEAALSQEIPPIEAKLSSMLEKNNPIRDKYLKTKYQMFQNQKLRQDLAEKILKA